jgi:hypothetical protein
MVDLERRIVHVGRVKGIMGALALHPLVSLQVALAVCRLPFLEVTVPHRHAAARFSDLSPRGEPILASRLANAVLDLGPDDDQYLAGRRKQALRTNLSHARRLGVQARRVPTYDEWLTAVADILRSRPDEEALLKEVRQPPGNEDIAYFVAEDHVGCPIAFDVAAVSNDCAVLIWGLSLADHPSRSAARYLLHTFMRSELRGRGVRYLIGGRTGGSPGLQYFQHLLGYEVYNLRVTVGDLAETELLPLEASRVAAVA